MKLIDIKKVGKRIKKLNKKKEKVIQNKIVLINKITPIMELKEIIQLIRMKIKVVIWKKIFCYQKK